MCEWIDIKEKLPELEKDVLLFDNWVTTDGEVRQDMKVDMQYLNKRYRLIGKRR